MMRWASASARTAALPNIWLLQSLSLPLVSRLFLNYGIDYQTHHERDGLGDANQSAATLLRRLPNLKVSIPTEELECSPRHKDVGILKLPVVW